MIIVYSSKSGSTEKYAQTLASRLGIRCFSVKEDIPSDEPIVFFGWLKGPSVVGLNHMDRSRLSAVCVTGLDSEGRFDKAKVSSKNNLNVPIYYLRGWIIREKIGVSDKMILLMVSVMMKLKGLNEFNQPIFDAMMEGGSFYDEKYLEPIETFCRPKI